MAKNKRRNRKSKAKKRRERYAKKEFLEIYCPHCGLCSDKPPNPIFCYEEMYKTNKERFFEKIFGELIMLRKDFILSNTSPKDITIEQFIDSICDSFCGNNKKCSIITTCFNTFRKQLSGNRKKNKKKNKSKKQKDKYICQPYPTIFSNNCKEWQDKIDRILGNSTSDGNNNRKQDKVEESTKHSKGQVDR
jgi:hypothetical protein